MAKQEKGYAPDQIRDAEWIGQMKQRVGDAEWPMIRMIITAYVDGIGVGMQISKEER